jgi:tetratricopeptide (TPR) repeat protein
MLSLLIETHDGHKLGLADTLETPRQPAHAVVPRLGIGDVADIVYEFSGAARFAAALAAYNSGQKVNFTLFQLSQSGIHAGKKTLPWPMVADIHVDGYFMVVQAIGQEQPWRAFKRNGTSNVDLVLALIEETRGTNFTAFQGLETTPILKQTLRRTRWRGRLIALLLLLLIIGGQAGYSYGSYYFSARGYFDRGREAYNQGDFATALTDFNTALQKEPTRTFYLRFRGDTHFKLGDLNAALADYREAVRLNPKDYYSVAHIGLVYQHQRNYRESLVQFNKSLAIEPRNVYTYCMRGASYQSLGQHNEARTDYLLCRDGVTAPTLKAEAERLLRSLPGR